MDAQPATLDPAGRLLRARHWSLRFADRFEMALAAIGAWFSRLLLLDYAPGAMDFATFAYARLPLADPYRASGPLRDNPWGHTPISVLLVAGDRWSQRPASSSPICTGRRTSCPSRWTPAA